LGWLPGADCGAQAGEPGVQRRAEGSDTDDDEECDERHEERVLCRSCTLFRGDALLAARDKGEYGDHE